MERKAHWTARSIEDFRFAIAFEFVAQLEEYMARRGLNRKNLASTLGISQGRVSQIFNDPGNLTLRLMVEWSRKIGSKMAIVLYDDGDSGGERGPIPATVFRECWARLGRPQNSWEVAEIEWARTGAVEYDRPRRDSHSSWRQRARVAAPNSKEPGEKVLAA